MELGWAGEPRFIASQFLCNLVAEACLEKPKLRPPRLPGKRQNGAAAGARLDSRRQLVKIWTNKGAGERELV
jgi:hypothetical protein